MRSYTLGKNQSVVVKDDGTEVFFSYGTEVCTRYLSGSVSLTEYWNYSRTTTKYLCQFLDISNKELKQNIKDNIYLIVNF
jgi:hypothetical protein